MIYCKTNQSFHLNFNYFIFIHFIFLKLFNYLIIKSILVIIIFIKQIEFDFVL